MPGSEILLIGEAVRRDGPRADERHAIPDQLHHLLEQGGAGDPLEREHEAAILGAAGERDDAILRRGPDKLRALHPITGIAGRYGEEVDW